MHSCSSSLNGHIQFWRWGSCFPPADTDKPFNPSCFFSLLAGNTLSRKRRLMVETCEFVTVCNSLGGFSWPGASERFFLRKGWTCGPLSTGKICSFAGCGINAWKRSFRRPTAPEGMIPRENSDFNSLLKPPSPLPLRGHYKYSFFQQLRRLFCLLSNQQVCR